MNLKKKSKRRRTSVEHEESALWRISVDFKNILEEVNKWECDHAECSCLQENDKNNEEINEKEFRWQQDRVKQLRQKNAKHSREMHRYRRRDAYYSESEDARCKYWIDAYIFIYSSSSFLHSSKTT